MQFANTNVGRRINIREAEEATTYFCPFCGSPMIQRRGQINIPHFAHAKGSLCSDDWKYEEMSEWHRSWQDYYPLDAQEYPVSREEERHRADVLINNTVIEFQHSPMSAEEFQRRNAFYTACGYRVVWLFDAREAYQTALSFDGCSATTYRWKHPPKTLTGFDYHSKVQVFFHLKDETSEEPGIVIRLTWCSDGDLSYFKSAQSECYTEAEFVELTSTGKVFREADMSRKDELYHQLYRIRRRNGEQECFGCPINKDGYAPQIHEYIRTSCDECKYCVEEGSDGIVVKCAGRFKDYLDDIVSVIGIEKAYDGAIYSISFIDKEGSIRDARVEIPDSPASSIFDLFREYDAGTMVVLNIRTGYQFKIVKDPEEMMKKYCRVYGYLWADKYNVYSKQSREIYGPGLPDWIVLWYRTKDQLEQFRRIHQCPPRNA